MCLARKLFLFAAMALTALAMTSTTAGAQGVEVLNEETNDHCDPIVFEGPHEVHDGCHIEFETTEPIPLVVQTAGGPVTISQCEVHLEARVGEDGEGYVTEAFFFDDPPVPNPPCTRAPCDEDAADSPMIPWPLHFEETASEQNVEVTFCLRTIASGEGGAPTSCEVHIPWNHLGEHVYEIGSMGTHSCENLPPVSIQRVHFINETDPHLGTEDIEIIHTGA